MHPCCATSDLPSPPPRPRTEREDPVRSYPLLGVRVTTPRLELRGATDELLDELAEVVRAGKTHADPAPYDDPMSFYEPDPDLRVAKWLRAIWRRRGRVEPGAWRLYFVVVLDGRPVGEQTLTGVDFATLGTVTSFSWLSVDERGRGLGHEMRAAILHLAFDGLGAKEASSDAFVDNRGSNAISQAPRLRAQRARLGDAAGRARPAQPVATHPGQLGTATPGRHRTARRRGLSRPPAVVLTRAQVAAAFRAGRQPVRRSRSSGAGRGPPRVPPRR